MELNIGKIIRVRNAYFDDIIGMRSDGEIEKFLKSKGFELKETSSDNFYFLYENSDYKNESKGTLILIRSGEEGDVADIIRTFIP